MAHEFRGVTKQFTTNSGAVLTAIRDVTFKVNEGEFVSVVGPSGCGKSTLLSMTAGLYQPTTGEVLVSDERVTGPNDHVGFMLQKDLLLPGWARRRTRPAERHSCRRSGLSAPGSIWTIRAAGADGGDSACVNRGAGGSQAELSHAR